MVVEPLGSVVDPELSDSLVVVGGSVVAVVSTDAVVSPVEPSPVPSTVVVGDGGAVVVAELDPAVERIRKKHRRYQRILAV